ncbi:chromosome partitioning protein ParA [Methylobacterium indicum]|uniref:Chromosome partitioning protein ParA n=1 Tax=Methylobacterium indicum TaxID=1775910 RepID=A0A0J6RHZ9_9HYPH|nr:plasmid partitioning protein RepA [Methylobacterium indicum]KMO11641.1 chromosome partitioning protein ParA [Methylobacterium indicum]KMO20867.1 chromosome partitioning protein ParA [Methylobacterium indicum]KTS27601.1 chromosome partitioning protein ParA [Methylobacterium indicum]KTS41487.1 chromosome partitioning protein ParA [Methylobacterium indicum]KTS52479.1 chromosome partitioning protein ParA [Methylobacterium indicum]
MPDLPQEQAPAAASDRPSITRIIAEDGNALSSELNALRRTLFPPASHKLLRSFSSGEAAKLIGVADGYLRQLSLASKGPQPEIGPGGRRSYTLGQINELRQLLDDGPKSKRYVPHRSGAEHCQVLAVVNFKGGSGKTTTAAHLAQYLALRGYRVLAVDLDPQASLTALHGYQPEFDVGPNQTLYAAIRHDDEQKPLAEVVRKTYFPGLDLVPGNLELMEFEHDTPRVLADRNAEPFFGRIATALGSVADDYDVMILDCPPQLGFLTLGALCAATAMLVTVHPQMLDVMSMCQFLLMASDLLGVVQEAGADLDYDFLRYVVTRYEPSDAPQTQMVGFMRSLFRERVLTHLMLKSTAVSDAGLSKQTLYEIGRESFTRATYDRAIEALDGVNGEIEGLMHRAWGRVPA